MSDPEYVDPQLGKLQFTLEYDFQKNELTVGVVQASDLPAVDMAGTTDPYVKVYVIPNTRKRFETKVQRKTLNPVFNETFYFHVKYEMIASKTLVMVIYDFDRFSKHDQIGVVKVNLKDVDLGRTTEEWRDVGYPEPETDLPNNLGDICCTLSYVPSTSKFIVGIVEAKNLNKIPYEKDTKKYDDDSEEEVPDSIRERIKRRVKEKTRSTLTSALESASKLKRKKEVLDPYVKISLYLNNTLLAKQKSTVKMNSTSPYYNESFEFDVTLEEIQKISCEIAVMDNEKRRASEPVGKVVLGCNTHGDELRHWSDMLANPRRSIALWHKLMECPQKDYLKFLDK